MNKVMNRKTMFAAGVAIVSFAPSLVNAQSNSARGSTEIPAGDIIVTATKQSTLLSKVPISMVAISKKDLDRQSVQTINDIARLTPELAVRTPASGDAIPSISIRGVASTIGAQTTGIYLDDTALQKRNAIGLSGSGTPIPVLFDLDRVEVLRGPQGTLYGGSSMGGTVRFITPTPSLTNYSVYAKTDDSTIQGGGLSYGAGVAVSVPIIKDTLGARISYWASHTGGYIDHVDLYNGDVTAKNTNTRDERVFRGALLWQASPTLSITPALYLSYSHQADSDVWWGNIPAGTTPKLTTGSYVYPAQSYGPYNTLGLYKTGAGCDVGANYAATITPCVGLQPRTTVTTIPTLTIDKTLGAVQVKSISSYIHDNTYGVLDYSFQPSQPLGGFPYMPTVESYQATANFGNRRNVFSEELRGNFTSSDNRLSIIGGIYYSNSKNISAYQLYENANDVSEALHNTATTLEAYNLAYHRYQDLLETEIAGFGQASYAITSKLKASAGVRVSHETFKYYQNTAGELAGFLVPTTANGGLTNGKLVETPVTPKFGLEYTVNDRDMFYASAAKGYRMGGVNQPPPAVRCASDLALLDITTTPATYGSDSLWSYEIGAKLRSRDSRFQVNASAFYIKWKNIQTAFQLPDCGFGYDVNAGSAISRGFDAQVQASPVDGLILRASGSYTDANYQDNIQIPNTPYLLIQKGDKLPVSPWALNVGAEYDFQRGNKIKPYIRLDYQYTSKWREGTGPLTAVYTPDTYDVPGNYYMTLRAGFTTSGVDLSVYANNLLNSHDLTSSAGGRNDCENTSCSAYALLIEPMRYTSFAPRTIGLTATYKY